MTTRNFAKELGRSLYYDMENGNDIDKIDNDCLISIIAELCGRIEQLEQRYQQEQND